MIDKPKILELSSDFQIKSELFSNIYYNNIFLTDNQTISDRLKHLLADLKLGKTEFAESINVDGGQWGKVLSGKMNITLRQILDISSKYDVRPGWIIDGELPIYKNKKSGSVEPDYLPILRKQISIALVSLEDAMKTLPQPLGPSTEVAGDPAFRQSGKMKRTEKQ